MWSGREIGEIGIGGIGGICKRVIIAHSLSHENSIDAVSVAAFMNFNEIVLLKEL